ncbi:MAG: hypothetical protein KJI69_04005 [Patescibacteria group bacterium]|nr:hypothetical protein [Patescibacteria group bacterium]
MAKKKSAIKTPLIAGVGLTIVILTPLLLLFAGIEVPIVGEVYANALGIDIVPQVPDGFEIPVPVITQSEIQQIQKIIDEIRKISTEDLEFARICLELELDPDFVGVCDELLQDAQKGVLTEQLLQNAIERIEALEKEIEEILPPPDLNNTDTSIDPPPVQICDEIDCIDIIIVPPIGTNTVVLSSLITKIDTQGNKTFTTEISQIPALSFFVEDVSNIDFSKGFLEIQTKASFRSDDPQIIGTADFDILINGESVLTDQITFDVDGVECTTICPVPAIFCGDDTGCSFTHFNTGVGAEFVSSIGLRSPSFTFSFEENFDKFPDGISTLEFVLINSDFTVDSVQNFQGTKNVLFSMDIAKDPNLIIIDDESGGTERIFPTDSVLKVTGATTAVTGTTCLLYEKKISDCPDCKVTLNRGSNSSPNNPDSCIANITTITFDTDTARVIGLNLLDDSGNLLQSFAGGQGEVLNELLPRNTNYTLTIASPSLSTDLSFPKSQQTQSYTCTNEYKVTYKRVEYESGEICVKCTSDGIYFRHTLVPDSFIVTKVTCDFPN